MDDKHTNPHCDESEDSHSPETQERLRELGDRIRKLRKDSKPSPTKRTDRFG